MLRALRNQTKSIFFKCFLVLLICGFALWGVGDLTGGYKSKSILSVNNQKITIEEVLNEINKARYLLPERPSLQDAIKSGMHKKILNKFEQELLINEEANDLELNVSLSEKMKLIKDEKAFKNPLGEFSQNKFKQSLNNAGLSEAKYLEMIETSAYFNQLTMPFMINDFYNKKIIKKMMDWQNEIREIEFQIFELIDKTDILRPSNEVLKLFYQDNKKNYEFPITRDIKFIEIKPSHFKDQVVVNKKLINEKYEVEKSNLKTEETRELFQIITQDETKANKFMDLIKKGRDFSEIAKKYFNLSVSDITIGYLKKSDLPLESSDKVFKANLDETLGPIKTKFGFNIYKIVNILPPKQINYNEAIKDIKKKLVEELSVEILFEKLDIIEDLIAEGNNIEEIVQSNVFNKNLLVKNLKNVSKNGLIYSYENDTQFLTKNEQFLRNIWDTDINELSEIFNSQDDTYYLIEVIKESNKQTPKYELLERKIFKHWLRKEQIIKSKEQVKNILLTNNKLSSKISIKRNDKSLNKFNDSFLINKIFNVENRDTNILLSQNNLVAVRVIESRTDNYNFDKKIYNQLNINFSKSFFNDFSNLYVQNLAIKHKLTRNYQEIENFLVKTQN